MINAGRSTDTKKSPNMNFLEKKNPGTFFLLKNASLQDNIRNPPFDQKSPRHLEVGVLRLCALGEGVNN